MLGHQVRQQPDTAAAGIAEDRVVADRVPVEPEGPVDDVLDLRFGDVATHPVEAQFFRPGSIELAVVREEEVFAQALAEPVQDPLAKIGGLLVIARRPRLDETEQAVAPHLGGETVGVDLHRIRGRPAADDHRRPSLVNRKLVPDTEFGQIRLGFLPRHVQEVAGVVEGEAVALDAAAGAAGLGLALQHHRRIAVAGQLLAGDKPGETAPDDHDTIHQPSMGTMASQANSPTTTTPTTAVKIRVDVGSRTRTTRPRAPKITATA